MSGICRICERLLFKHSDNELAKCLTEDDRREALKRLEFEISWERQQNERRLEKR